MQKRLLCTMISVALWGCNEPVETETKQSATEYVECWTGPGGIQETGVCHPKPQNLPPDMWSCDNDEIAKTHGRPGWVVIRTMPATNADFSNPSGWCVAYTILNKHCYMRIATTPTSGGWDTLNDRIAWTHNRSGRRLTAFAGLVFTGAQASSSDGRRRNYDSMNAPGSDGITSLATDDCVQMAPLPPPVDQKDWVCASNGGYCRGKDWTDPDCRALQSSGCCGIGPVDPTDCTAKYPTEFPGYPDTCVCLRPAGDPPPPPTDPVPPVVSFQ